VKTAEQMEDTAANSIMVSNIYFGKTEYQYTGKCTECTKNRALKDSTVAID